MFHGYEYYIDPEDEEVYFNGMATKKQEEAIAKRRSRKTMVMVRQPDFIDEDKENVLFNNVVNDIDDLSEEYNKSMDSIAEEEQSIHNTTPCDPDLAEACASSIVSFGEAVNFTPNSFSPKTHKSRVSNIFARPVPECIPSPEIFPKASDSELEVTCPKAPFGRIIDHTPKHYSPKVQKPRISNIFARPISEYIPSPKIFPNPTFIGCGGSLVEGKIRTPVTERSGVVSDVGTPLKACGNQGAAIEVAETPVHNLKVLSDGKSRHDDVIADSDDSDSSDDELDELPEKSALGILDEIEIAEKTCQSQSSVVSSPQRTTDESVKHLDSDDGKNVSSLSKEGCVLEDLPTSSDVGK